MTRKRFAFFALALILVLAFASSCRLISPSYDKAKTESQQYAEMQKQTAIMEREAAATERIAASLERIATALESGKN